MFEAGIAVGQDKPLLVVADSKIKLPPALAGVLTIRARLDDIHAIDFALDQARGRTPHPPHRVAASGRPLGSQVDELLARLSVPVEGSTEREAVAVLQTALEESGVIAAQGGGADDFFDLGIWSDDLDSIAANPLLVEVKRVFSTVAFSQVLRHLDAHPTARMALVVSLLPIEGRSVKGQGAGTYPVLAIELRDLLERMRTSSFAEVVRAMRNRSVHGLPL
jgi:hypothetical protein